MYYLHHRVFVGDGWSFAILMNSINLGLSLGQSFGLNSVSFIGLAALIAIAVKSKNLND